jgi:hypothetical protein
MGNSRTWRRRLKANQPNATERRLQKRYRKSTGSNVKVRLKASNPLTGPGAGGDATEEDEPT